MPTIGQLVVNLVGNTANFNQSMIEARNTLKSVRTSVAATVAATAAMAVASKAVSLGAQFESTEMAFKTLLKDAQLAKNTLAELSQFAAETPFQLPEVEQGAKQLLGYGFSANQLVPALRQLGDISAGLKIPLDDLIYLYGTSSQQAHLFTRDINQFASRGIPIIDELSKVLRVSKSEVMDMTSDGQVNFSHLQQAIANLTSEGGQFAGVMANAATTLEGRYSNLQDNITLAMREIGTEIIKAFDLKGIVETAIGFTNQIKDAVKNYGGEVIALVGIIVSFASGMAIARGAMLAYNVAMKMATTSATIFQIVTNPAFVFQLVVGLGAAAVAMDVMDEAYRKAANSAGAGATAQSQFADATSKAAKSAAAARVEIAQLPAELDKQIKALAQFDKEIGAGKMTANVAARRQGMLDNIGSLISAPAETKDPNTAKLDALWQAYSKIRDAQDSIKDNKFELAGIEKQINDLSGVTKELEKIKQETEEIKYGADHVKAHEVGVNATSSARAELAAAIKERDAAKLAKKQDEDGKAAAKSLAENTRTPVEKFQAEIERLKGLKDSGHIDDKLLDRGLMAASDQLDKSKPKGSKDPIAGVGKASAEAQELIARAMTSGTGNPNKTLEDETKRNGETFKQAVSYLAELANRKPKDPEVVENV